MKEQTQKKWSPIKFPQEGPKTIVVAEPLTQKKMIRDRLGPPPEPESIYDRLGTQIVHGQQTTPLTSRPASCPLAQRNLLNRSLDPWMNGHAPFTRDQMHQSDRARFGTDPNARPGARHLWWNTNNDEAGRNDPNEAENEEELGTAGQTETDDEN